MASIRENIPYHVTWGNVYYFWKFVFHLSKKVLGSFYCVIQGISNEIVLDIFHSLR